MYISIAMLIGSLTGPNVRRQLDVTSKGQLKSKDLIGHQLLQWGILRWALGLVKWFVNISATGFNELFESLLRLVT